MRKNRLKEIAQVEFVGSPFTKVIDKRLPNHSRQTRRVRVVAGYSIHGDVTFHAAKEVPIAPSQLPHISLSKADSMHFFDEVGGAQLKTVLKHSTSQSGVDIYAEFEKRGGKPDFRLPKTGGFFSTGGNSQHKLAKNGGFMFPTTATFIKDRKPGQT